MVKFSEVPSYVWIIVFIGIMLGMGGLILITFMAQAATQAGLNNVTAVNMINDTLQSLTTFTDWLPLIIVIVIVSILLTLLIGSLAFGGRR